MARYKYADFSFGDAECIFNMIGGPDVVRALQRGEKTLTVQDAVRLLVDRNARRIPYNLRHRVCDASQARVAMVEVGYVGVERAKLALSGVQYPDEMEFLWAICRLRDELRGMPQVANLLNGPCLPIVVPQIRFDDYGQTMVDLMIPAVRRAYRKQFPGHKCENYYKGKLAGQVAVIPESRHQVLLNRMQHGYVIGLYFPNPLQGFSVLAQREQMETLPDGFLLAGGFDAAMAMIMHPDVLARAGKTPVYDLSALHWQSSEDSFAFRACGDRLLFDRTTYIGLAGGSSTGSLLFLGEGGLRASEDCPLD